MEPKHTWKRFVRTGLAPCIAAHLGRLHNWSCPSSVKKFSQSMWVGDYGEWVAYAYVKSQGYVILKSNWKHRRGGEIDLVCRDGDTLCFIEVKTRTLKDWGNGLRAVNAKKRHLIRSGAAVWLHALNRPEVLYRYDVIEIILSPSEKPEIRHIQAAFYDSERH